MKVIDEMVVFIEHGVILASVSTRRIVGDMHRECGKTAYGYSKVIRYTEEPEDRQNTSLNSSIVQVCENEQCFNLGLQPAQKP